jgi:hypothetical protein
MTTPSNKISAIRILILLLVSATVIVGLLMLGPLVFGQKDPQGFVRIRPEEVKWVDEPDGHGVQKAVIEGDPSKPGIYVVRMKFPPYMMSRNHFHGEDRYAVVLKGTWYTGTGDEFAADKTVGLKVGSFMKHPAGAHHFDGAKDEEVIVQIIGYGPSSTTQIRPNESHYGSIKK